MRTLTSVRSSTNVLTDLEFHLLASDQSTTWIFDRNDIINMSGLNWEVSFGGGFGKPSNYNITLNTSMGFITSQFTNIIRGETFLKIYVNSDNFTPHVGRVRNIDRKAENPNLLTLRIYDRFLDNNPLFPVESLVDSYSTLHPDVLNIDMGYPVYYGKHARPFYMTPVDCSLGSLIGPRNISSENHVTSVYYVLNTSNSEYVYFAGKWDQQSGGTNVVSNDQPFELHEIDPQIPVGLRMEKSDNTKMSFLISPTLDGVAYTIGQQDATSHTTPIIGAVVKNNEYVNRTNMLFATKLFAAVNVTINNSPTFHRIYLSTNSYFEDLSPTGVYCELKNAWATSFDLTSQLSGQSWNFLEGNGTFYTSLSFDGIINTSGTPASVQTCYDFWYRAPSDAYNNYDIYGIQQNCSDVALSENPIFIFSDICSQAAINFVASQASLSQFDTSSYNFQCHFDERRSIGKIGDEFGRISGTYLWVGDSGFLNFRTYQESSTIQNSDLIDFTITTSDILRDSLRILDNPLGTTIFETKKAKKIKINYEYNFTTNRYRSNITADPSNNAFCESAQAAGISDEITLRTRYILESDTASLYLQNAVRQSTQDESILEMSLPARFFEAEIGDICKVEHPAIIGSESLYQIIFADPDYFRGEVKLKLYEILNL